MPTMQYDKTALIRAAENGNTECARLLIEGGADADVPDTVRVGAFVFAPRVIALLNSHQHCMIACCLNFECIP
jgi:hypothetical protein